LTTDPLEEGAYRYMLMIEGQSDVDPCNPVKSKQFGMIHSVVYVPGTDFMDSRNVPHGTVAQASYDKEKRIHVYTPPGYEKSNQKYPVLYLLHEAGACDDTWTTVGRANFILDNLIAAGKAKPMVVVMPNDDTPLSGGLFFGSSRTLTPAEKARFKDEFFTGIRRYIESHYRVIGDRANRAIAGPYSGDWNSLNLFEAKPSDFAFVGVFNLKRELAGPSDWESSHLKLWEDGAAKDGLKVLWIGANKTDIQLPIKTLKLIDARDVINIFNKHGFKPQVMDVPDGRDSYNLPHNLNEFAPRLFQ
jgi:hypothetical protein